MPRTAEERRGRLSETNIIDFSNIIANRIFKNWEDVKADKNIGDSHIISAIYDSFIDWGIF